MGTPHALRQVHDQARYPPCLLGHEAIVGDVEAVKGLRCPGGESLCRQVDVPFCQVGLCCGTDAKVVPGKGVIRLPELPQPFGFQIQHVPGRDGTTSILSGLGRGPHLLQPSPLVSFPSSTKERLLDPFAPRPVSLGPVRQVLLLVGLLRVLGPGLQQVQRPPWPGRPEGFNICPQVCRHSMQQCRKPMQQRSETRVLQGCFSRGGLVARL